MRAANDQNLFRRTIEQEVERLLGILDGMDGDCDMEDGTDKEPSLGWSEMEGRYGCHASRDDRELEDENDENGSDDEPEETDEDGDEQDSSRSEDDHHLSGTYLMGRFDGGAGL